MLLVGDLWSFYTSFLFGYLPSNVNYISCFRSYLTIVKLETYQLKYLHKILHIFT